MSDDFGARAARCLLAKLNNMLRFILAIINHELIINNRERGDIEADLQRDGYDKFPSQASLSAQNGDEKNGGASFTYLFRMPILSFTFEKVEELKKEVKTQERRVALLEEACGRRVPD